MAPNARRASIIATSSQHDSPLAARRYEAYSRLQAAAVAFGETLPIPEIVVVGGQSDGKSSLLEAFLGFRFNVRDVELGTRRPLIVQMVHNSSALEPICQLQQENGDAYGAPIRAETDVAAELVRRTEEHLRGLGGATVSAKPIVMRAEYAYCSNLTLIDTPGFILKARSGEADGTPNDILNMVKAQAAPANRLILFLQQSSVEWASSLWLKTIQDIDPQFQRTVIVVSKFDNRLKEFSERWEVDRYLSAQGYLPQAVKPFFVALPKDRGAVCSQDWRQQLQDVDAGVFQHLRNSVKNGFDEERFGSQIGFGNLKQYLDAELSHRYREAAPAMLTLLQERCDAVAAELAAVAATVASIQDVAALRRAAMRHAAAMSTCVQELFSGTCFPDANKHGATTEEERASSGVSQWPGVSITFKPPNASLRLFGAASFERCLNEFQEAAHAIKFPSVARDRAANVLLAYKGKYTSGGAARAAEDIARQAALECFAPVLDTACLRLGYIMRSGVDLACTSRALDTTREAVEPFAIFQAAMLTAHHKFIAKLEVKAQKLVRKQLDVATSQFALSAVASLSDFWLADERRGGREPEVEADPTECDNSRQFILRAQEAASTPSLVTVPETPSPEPDSAAAKAKDAAKRNRVAAGALPARHLDLGSPAKGRANKPHRLQDMDRDTHGCLSYGDLVRYAEGLFNRIRQVVACQQAPIALKAAFLGPIQTTLATDVAIDLFARLDGDFMSMFTAVGVLADHQTRLESLQKRVDVLTKCKTDFAEILSSL